MEFLTDSKFETENNFVVRDYHKISTKNLYEDSDTVFNALYCICDIHSCNIIHALSLAL